MKLYEGMFLIDNAEVRSDWSAAKALVTGTLEKHGANVRSARRWDERRLAYSINKKNRATYLLAYYEMEGAASEALRRDFDLSEKVLRYLILSAESVPEQELELSQAEAAEGFTIPPPPDDDFLEAESAVEEVPDDDDDDRGRGDRRRRGRRSDDEGDSDLDSDDDSSNRRRGPRASEED